MGKDGRARAIDITLSDGGAIGDVPPVAAAGFDAAYGGAPAVSGYAPQHASTANKIQGTVKNWNDEKGFGFIDPIDGSENIFVHRADVVGADGRPVLQKGMPVLYEVGTGKDG